LFGHGLRGGGEHVVGAGALDGGHGAELAGLPPGPGKAPALKGLVAQLGAIFVGGRQRVKLRGAEDDCCVAHVGVSGWGLINDFAALGQSGLSLFEAAAATQDCHGSFASLSLAGVVGPVGRIALSLGAEVEGRARIGRQGCLIFVPQSSVGWLGGDAAATVHHALKRGAGALAVSHGAIPEGGQRAEARNGLFEGGLLALSTQSTEVGNRLVDGFDLGHWRAAESLPQSFFRGLAHDVGDLAGGECDFKDAHGVFVVESGLNGGGGVSVGCHVDLDLVLASELLAGGLAQDRERQKSGSNHALLPNSLRSWQS